ncbi:GNAT family N-acetyltransferase [Nodosilinea sp. LEGE 06152]|uniref:GNAT family N-acetyltransferase n=1 Tax=Nodosilinea sp. LEGE 06152 TaxID=2777966 RepID=UPI00188242CF|nr:GNAT family N-acetyltransferase [Nodosilinea sp. LEGE 06152]MBE9159325.1 GNAT family N-acetyltransferase [Nodosilinea sp. LEGE 06152]
MAPMMTPGPTLTVRPLQYRDLDDLKQWQPEDLEAGGDRDAAEAMVSWLDFQRRWYGPLKVMSWLPRPVQQQSQTTFVAERQKSLVGLIQVSPFNQTRSTWRVDQVVVNRRALADTAAPGTSGYMDVGSRLLRHCFEVVWEARTWMIEVDVSYKSALALYRFNGFQPLAQITYWALPPEQIAALAQREPDLPNLLPISNADAQLLYQLDTASMPPLVRQVFDHQIQDFKTGLLSTATATTDRLVNQVETVSAYVFEQQRKAAIGQFKLAISRDGKQPHTAGLTVHPAYTWLYPELMTQMAKVLHPFPAQSLRLTSLDYQPEREECFTQIQAIPESHALLMSRSVWHKVREARHLSLEGLQLSDVFTGLQPAGKPIPGRMTWSAERWPVLGSNKPEGSTDTSGSEGDR